MAKPFLTMILVALLWLRIPLSYAESINNASFPGSNLPRPFRPKIRLHSQFHHCGQYQTVIEDALAGVRHG
ncbi:hypothetical protein FQN49_001417, partial [Arthroderma sp. PD_2]